MTTTTQKMKDGARQATEDVKPWVVILARLGYFAKGIVYALMGLLAFQAALGTRSAKVDQKTAMLSIITQPFGKFLLALTAIGLVGYVIWRLVQTFLDPERRGTNLKGLVARSGYLVSGIGYGALALWAFQIVLGRGGSAGGNGPRDITALAMGNPLGVWLVGLVGLIAIGAGLRQLYQAYTSDLGKEFQLTDIHAEQRTWAERLGRAGYAARGVVYTIIGIFLVQAAYTHNPNRAGGLGEALQALAQQPYGAWLLGAVALGLLAYGLYAMVMARYRRIYIR